MSASREKKSRQDVAPQGPTEREQKKQREAKEARRSNILYTTVGIICVVLVVFLLVWRSGMIQRSAAAVTINGTKYTAADVQYYFNLTLQQNGVSNASSLKSMVVDPATGKTMYDSLMDQSIQTMVTTTAAADKAEAEGFTLSDESQAQLDDVLKNMESAWEGTSYSSLDAFIRANYGPYMTHDRLVNLISQYWLASNYINSVTDGFTYNDADYQTYYNENANALDTFTLTQFALQAKVDTKDADGSAIEMTDDEKAAALEESKAQVKAVAEELQAKLAAGEDPSALAEEYADQLFSSGVSEQRIGSKVNTAYSEWAFDSARKNGDVTISEYESSDTSYYYYVVRYEGRALDQSNTADVRHILVKPETDEGASEPTQAQSDAAKAKAQELLDQWKAGEATEDSFAALAQTDSADTGSASNGGLISGISASSTYVDSFKNWALDPARKTGDTDLVESSYGWHIMYYVANGDPAWKQTALSAMSQEDFTEWQTAATEGYEPSTGLGLKFVQG